MPERETQEALRRGSTAAGLHPDGSQNVSRPGDLGNRTNLRGTREPRANPSDFLGDL